MTEYVQTLREWVRHVQKLISLKEAHTGRLSEIEEDWYDRTDYVGATLQVFISQKGLRPRMADAVASRRRKIYMKSRGLSWRCLCSVKVYQAVNSTLDCKGQIKSRVSLSERTCESIRTSIV
jgi:hypothetical protein